MSRDDYRLRRLVSERRRREARVMELQQEPLTPRDYAAKLALLQDEMGVD
jgi:hypothetical protein